MGKTQQFAVAAIFIILGALLVARPGFGDSAPPQISDAAVQTRPATVPDDAEVVSYDDEIELQGAYTLEDNAIAQTPTDAHGNIWQLVTELVPQDLLQEHFVQFNVASDGPHRTLAMVHRSGRHENGWILTIDSADTFDVDVLRATLLHELAHVLTLPRSDVTFNVPAEACNDSSWSVGCVDDDSIMGRYANQFWSGRDEPTTFDAASFVNTYASESAHEDLAETFLMWVLDVPTSDDQPGVAERYAFFDGEPTLTAAKTLVTNPAR